MNTQACMSEQTESDSYEQNSSNLTNGQTEQALTITSIDKQKH